MEWSSLWSGEFLVITKDAQTTYKLEPAWGWTR